MKKQKLLTLSLAVLMSATLVSCGDNDKPAVVETETIEVTDIYNRKVKVKKDVKKAVCLGGGALRMYSYIADLNKLAVVEKSELEKSTRSYIGRTYQHFNYPKLNKELPIVGFDNKNPNEALLNIKPDVVFWATHSPKDLDLYSKKIDCPIIAVNQSEEEMHGEILEKSLRLIGETMNAKKRTEEFIDYLHAMEKELSDSVEAYKKQNPISKDVEVYVGAVNFRGSQNIFTGRPYYQPFELAHVKNWLKGRGKIEGKIECSMKIPAEKFYGEEGPDRIILDAAGVYKTKESFEKNDSDANMCKGIKAIQEGNVWMQLPYTSYHVNIENGWANAYAIANAAYPGLFGKDFNLDDKVNEIFENFYGVKNLYSDPSKDNDFKRSCFNGFQKVGDLQNWLLTEAWNK